MAVHFERNQRSADCVAGTRLSTKGMQPMASIGVPSVDRILGGGLALNSITILGFDQILYHLSHRLFEWQKKIIIINTLHFWPNVLSPIHLNPITRLLFVHRLYRQK